MSTLIDANLLHGQAAAGDVVQEAKELGDARWSRAPPPRLRPGMLFEERNSQSQCRFSYLPYRNSKYQNTGFMRALKSGMSKTQELIRKPLSSLRQDWDLLAEDTSRVTPSFGYRTWFIIGKQATRLHSLKKLGPQSYCLPLVSWPSGYISPRMADFAPTSLPVCPNSHPLQPSAVVPQLLSGTQDGCRAAFYKPYIWTNQAIYTRTTYQRILKVPSIPAVLILKLLLLIKDTEIYVATMKTQKTYFTVLLLLCNAYQHILFT